MSNEVIYREIYGNNERENVIIKSGMNNKINKFNNLIIII